MAYTVSRSQTTFTESEKERNSNSDQLKLTKEENNENAKVGSGISSEVHLLSSSNNSKSSSCESQSLDKKVVLRRIRQRKVYNKAKSALEALLGKSEANNSSSSATAQEHKWLQLGDTFSAP